MRSVPATVLAAGSRRAAIWYDATLGACCKAGTAAIAGGLAADAIATAAPTTSSRRSQSTRFFIFSTSTDIRPIGIRRSSLGIRHQHMPHTRRVIQPIQLGFELAPWIELHAY